MFKSLFTFYSNIVDTPFIQSKINIFFYINARIFKLKLNNFIVMSITGTSNFKFKELKVFFFLDGIEYLYVSMCIYMLVFIFIIVYL